MNLSTPLEKNPNSTKISLQSHQKQQPQILDQFQLQKEEKSIFETQKIKDKQQNKDKKKNKKNINKLTQKNVSKKKLIKNQISLTTKKPNTKSPQKQKTKNITQLIIRNQQNLEFPHQNQSTLVNKNPQRSPSKKTIISQKNMGLKSFNEEIQQVEALESGSNFFGSLDNYLKNPEEIKINSYKNVQCWNTSSNICKNQKTEVGQKFLSKILRKIDIEPKFNKDNKLPQISSKKKHQNDLERKQQKLKKIQASKNIFHNDQLSKHLAQNPISILQRPNKELSNEKSKFLRIKTEVIHTIVNTSIEKQECRKFSNNSQRYYDLSNDFSPYKFVPASISSIGTYKNINTQNSAQSLLQSDVIHQCYQNLKSKSKKLLRFSLIRQPNLSLLQNKRKSKNMQSQLDSLKEFVVKEKNKIKLPLIAKGVSLKQKKSQTQKPSILNSIYQYKRNPKLKETIDLERNRSQIFKKYQNHLYTDNIKDRLRCYTEPDSIQQTVHTEGLKHKISSQQSKNIQPSDSFKNNMTKKSLSSKIIQNFHERSYKNNDSQCSSRNKISSLNMSQNFISRYRDSFDWQHKKKLIIKKLGIVI